MQYQFESKSGGLFISFEPQKLDDGWEISTPSEQNIDSLRLIDIFREYHTDDNIWQVRSLLVFRNGYLVAESYTKDDKDILTQRAIRSAAKQVVGLLTGIAVEEQIIKNIDDPISGYLPETENFPDKKDITIRDLLTMRSGISYSNDGLGGQTDDILRQLPERIKDFIPGRPLKNNPRGAGSL